MAAAAAAVTLAAANVQKSELQNSSTINQTKKKKMLQLDTPHARELQQRMYTKDELAARNNCFWRARRGRAMLSCTCMGK